MAGICGWFGCTHLDAGEAGTLLARLVDGLAGPRRGQRATVLGSGWALGGSAARGAARVHRLNDDVVMIHGEPRFNGQPAGKWRHADLAATYRTEGPDFLRRLSGPFALVIVLEPESRLLLAIDRIGICPLYYAPADHGVVFASSLPVLKLHPRATTEPDPQSLFHYLHLHMIPAPRTVYRDLHKLCAAGFVEVHSGNLKSGEYWRVRYTDEHAKRSVAELKPAFREAIRIAIEDALPEDAQGGCFLSGGTDSSTVAGYLGVATGAPARTFSIGFDEPGYDELSYARLVARHFATEHHEYRVTPADIVTLIPRIPETYGEPFGNSSVVPAYYCARLARDAGVDILLGGDGGDELFGGNSRYAKMLLFEWYYLLPRGVRQSLLEPMLNVFPAGDRIMPVRKARRYVEQAHVPMPARLETYNLVDWFGSERLFESEFLAAIDTRAPQREQAQYYASAQAETVMNRMLALDLKYTLTDNDLPKVGRMCELAGIEVAYPFLRDPVVDFSTRLPADLKVRRLRLRYFFKKALADLLPREVIRKSKHGFGLPFGRWVVSDSDLHELACDTLEDLKQRRVIRATFIDELLNTHMVEEPHFYGGLVWLLVILEHWFRDDAARVSATPRLTSISSVG